MDDYVTLRSLIVGLRSASSFEEASDMCLRVMLDVTRRGLELTAPQARVLRATVHLRSHEGYRRVHTLEEDVRPRQTHDDPSSLQSANAWRWIVRHARPVTIDVVLGMVHPTSRHEEDAGPSTPGFGNAETRQRLLGRNVTHVHVVPLHGVGGGIEGMISVEAHCPPLGAGVVPRPSLELLEALAAAAAPSLISLPAQRIDPPARDPLLPVVGGAMSGTVDLVRLFARQEETLLLVGPTGTGKSRLARWAHAQSKRREHTFETVDLLSVPEDVQSAELFGWKRGAFTGAVQDTP
ncbi:MAG TPA: sigma 54-interacting transcriptional regulator, partial [Polyangiaceae bacterium]|nr:sigma 54-interacting transcriptional regulator [Polyangiaceae bacterium]